MSAVFDSVLRKALVTVALALSLGSAAEARVVLDLRDASPGEDSFEAIRDSLRAGIRGGHLDRHALRLPLAPGAAVADVPADALTTVGDRRFLIVDASTFDRLPARAQAAAVERLATYYDRSFISSYKASVDPARNDLAAIPFFGRVGRSVAGLGAPVDATALLSSYAERWAYRASEQDGPNCWHTSIASTNVGWSNHRYMNPAEFACHLRTSFREIRRDELEFGDVVRLYDDAGDEVHGFVYLGVDAADPAHEIVFTKNGYAQGYYLVQDFTTVTDVIYPGNRVSFHRAVGRAVDPSAQSDVACSAEYQSEAGAADARDGVLEAGLRRLPAEQLPPLDL